MPQEEDYPAFAVVRGAVSLTVAELIEKLQNIPEDYQNAIIYVGETNVDGEGNFGCLNHISLGEREDDVDNVIKEVWLDANSFDYEKG